MSFCSGCGKPNSASAKFCIACGAAINKPLAVIDSTILDEQNPSVLTATGLPITATGESSAQEKEYQGVGKTKSGAAWLLIIPAFVLAGGGIWYFGFHEKQSPQTSITTDSFSDQSGNALKEESLLQNQTPGTTIKSSEDNSGQTVYTRASAIVGTYTIVPDKSFFFSEPDFSAQRKAYLVNGDFIEIEKIDGEFAYGTYTSASGRETKGWVLLSHLQSNIGGADEAQFPGGEQAFKSYLKNHLKNDVVYQVKDQPGNYTVMVGFIVDTEGNPIEVSALNEEDNALGAEAVRLIQEGPKWVSATNAGQATSTYVKIPVTFFYSAE